MPREKLLELRSLPRTCKAGEFMPTSGFHSEWITIGHHRVLLECRAGYPDEWMRFLAQVAATTCDANSEGRARITQIYFDDHTSIWRISIASDDEADRSLEQTLMTVFHTMLNHGNCEPQITIVRPAETDSDHYQRTEHLSAAAGVAVDRWRHRDSEYMATVRLPR